MARKKKDQMSSLKVESIILLKTVEIDSYPSMGHLIHSSYWLAVFEKASN